MEPNETMEEWKSIFDEILHRIKSIGRPLFLLYMLIFLLCSPIGIYFEIRSGNTISIINAIITYSIALITAMITEYILIDNYTYVDKILGMMSCLILIISMIMFYLSSSDKAILPSAIGCLLTVIVWSLSYSSNKKFGKARKPETATGREEASEAGLHRGVK